MENENMLFIQDIDAEPHLIINAPIAELIQSVFNSSVQTGEAIHKTPVSELQGDALDQVEVEMINDDLYKKATSNLNERGNLVMLLLSQIDDSKSMAIQLTDEHVVEAFISVLNTCHAHLNREFTETFNIGESQGLEEETSILVQGKDTFEIIAKQLIAIMLSEIMELWMNSF